MKGYELVEDEFEYGINFYFVSSGKRNVMKMIGIENFMTYESKEVYNLGFGDYDFKRLGEWFLIRCFVRSGDFLSCIHMI